MSWISGLADKAENILNKIDQNAATALQIPANGEGGGTIPNTLDSMRKSLSNSTLSLKSTLSPARVVSRRGSHTVAKSDGGNSMTNSAEYNSNKLEWSLAGDMTSSRRSSISSKAESITIDMDGENGTSTEALENAKKTYKATLLAASTSTTALDTQELAAFKIALAEVTSERDELRLRLLSLNRDVENACLKQRVHDLEVLVQRLTEERDNIQHDWNETQTTSSAYVHSISELETNLAKLQQEYVEIAQKLQMQMRETEQNRQELQEYRTKAHRALQMKDNLIAELKSNNSGAVNNDSSANESDVRVLQIEFDALKHEHQQMVLENQNLMSQVQEARHDLHTLTKNHSEQMNAVRLNEEAMAKELRTERERTLVSESEQRLLTQELQNLRQQHSNQVAALHTRLQGRDQQLEQIRADKFGISANNGLQHQLADYDSRIKTLTQTLVNKQNEVEKITAERNAFRIQLEKVQDQLHQTTYNNSGSNKSTRNALLSNSTDDVKAQFPLLIRENPFDNRVARRVKRAGIRVVYGMDSAGIRLGAFLRRYPLMRILVLMYVALLHIWVIFVLLSTTPNQ